MRRTLLLSLLVVGAAVALILGSYSALAGAGPVADVASAVIGAGGPDDGGDPNDGNPDDVDGQGEEQVAEAIANTFDGVLTAEADGVSQEDVLALHDQGIGFGALFKLFVLAAATDTTVADLLATMDSNGDGEFEFAFGKRFKELADEVSALSAEGDGIPKNLGQAVSNEQRSDAGAAVAAADGGEDAGKGPPDQAPAHGRR